MQTCRAARQQPHALEERRALDLRQERDLLFVCERRKRLRIGMLPQSQVVALHCGNRIRAAPSRHCHRTEWNLYVLTLLIWCATETNPMPTRPRAGSSRTKKPVPPIAKEPAADTEVTATQLERREIPSFSESREARIAEAAYWRAERRGFTSGQELDDWLAAEKEVDEDIATKRTRRDRD